MRAGLQASMDKRIVSLLVKGINFVFTGGQSGNWGDVRSTSHAILLLSDFALDRHRSWVNEPARWLVERLRLEKKRIRSYGETKSWESEVWDTSLAIRAVMLANVELQENLIPPIRWLLGLRDKSGNKTWHDEPWETAHALFAIFDARKDPVQFRRACGSIEVDEEDLRDTVHWYIGLQDPKGKAITHHYTAFLLLILENALLQFTNQQQLPHYNKVIQKATNYLISVLRNSPGERLWTSEAWSNGYILQSLCRSHTFEKLHSNPELIERIVTWFEKTPERNEKDGYWGGQADIEDTANALQGLLDLLVAIRELTTPQSRHQIIEGLQREIMALLEIPDKPPKAKLIRSIQDGYIIHISEKSKKVIKWMILIVAALSAISGAIALFDYVARAIR